MVEAAHMKKYARQIGSFPQVDIWNHHLDHLPRRVTRRAAKASDKCDKPQAGHRKSPGSNTTAATLKRNEEDDMSGSPGNAGNVENNWSDMGVSGNRDFSPKMDGENNGKPL